MSTFKKRIQEQIVNPAELNRRNLTVIGVVTKSDEKTNLCSVRFIDKDGYESNKDNIPVKIYNSSFIDWFPVKNELVNLKVTGNEVCIESKFEGGYGVTVRPKTAMDSDIYPTTFTGAIGGFIL